MLNIFWGYFLSFAYMILVILIGELIQKRFHTDKEMTRKVEHIATSASWVLCYFFVGPTYHLVIVNLLAFIALALITFTGAMQSVEREDVGRSYGLFYFGLSTFINIAVAMLVDVKLVPMTAIAYYCLSLADGLAPIVAKWAGKRNVTLFAPKSLVGFLTVFGVSCLVTAVCNLVFELSYSALFIISLGSLAAHAELYGIRGLDNLSVPFAVFGYLVLQYYGYVSVSTEIALTVLSLFTVMAAYSGALTYFGGLVSFCYLATCAVIAPPSVISMILILFLVEALVARLASKRQGKQGAKHSARNGYQIFANAVISFLCVALYYFTHVEFFQIASVVVLAEEFSDSIASCIGRFSSHPPVDILKFKRIERGISGGVSLLGSASAVVASFVAVSIVLVFEAMTPAVYLIAVAVAFFGTMIDSILGSAVQVLYRCRVCAHQTESAVHCAVPAEKIKGIALINNTAVNLLSGALTAVLAIGVLALL